MFFMKQIMSRKRSENITMRCWICAMTKDFQKKLEYISTPNLTLTIIGKKADCAKTRLYKFMWIKIWNCFLWILQCFCSGKLNKSLNHNTESELKTCYFSADRSAVRCFINTVQYWIIQVYRQNYYTAYRPGYLGRLMQSTFYSKT